MKYFILALALVLSGCTICTNPGHGKKIGRIVKLERVGLLSKTWEGELIRGGFVDGSGSMGSVFHFTIEDEDLSKKALACVDDQSEVILHYRIELFSSLFRSEDLNPRFVEAIEIH
jgi:hypothetical protein